MLKKTLTYTDYNGQTKTRDFYFNLSKAELASWEMSENMVGGLGVKLQGIIAAGDGRAIMDTFKDIIRRSVGERTADGESFVKNDEIADRFMGSPAYDELFMELVTSPDAASDFINGVVPSNLQQVGEDIAQRQQAARRAPQDHLPKSQPERELPTVSQDPQTKADVYFEQFDAPLKPKTAEQVAMDRAAYEAWVAGQQQG